MSMDDPGWQGGLTPPAPSTPGGGGGIGGLDKRVLFGGIGVVVVVIAVVAFLALGSNGSSPSSTTSTTSAAGTSSTATTTGGGTGTIPTLGVTVASAGAPLKNSGGTQVTTCFNATCNPIIGVSVTAVSASIGGKASPASSIPLKVGDVIWGIGATNASSYNPITSGSSLSAFLSLTAAKGVTVPVFVYYYDSSTGNHDSDPATVTLAQISGNAANIDCTSTAGC